MRKVTTVGVTLLAALTLTACGSTSSDTSSSSSDATSSSSVATSSSSAKQLPAEYRSAITKAETYSDMMHMSEKGIYRQLTSSSGEGFTKKAAYYAVTHIKADWNKNALAKAKDYQDQQAMSPANIKTQLTSSYGEQFTESQAEYAIQHLND